MNRSVKIGLAFAFGAGIAGVVSYKLITDERLRRKLFRNARDIYTTSKKKFSGVTEEVMMRTAKLTNNPQVNQEWVENQWDRVCAEL